MHSALELASRCFIVTAFLLSGAPSSCSEPVSRELALGALVEIARTWRETPLVDLKSASIDVLKV
jgi:hypothetical protein